MGLGSARVAGRRGKRVVLAGAPDRPDGQPGRKMACYWRGPVAIGMPLGLAETVIRQENFLKDFWEKPLHPGAGMLYYKCGEEKRREPDRSKCDEN